MERDDLALAQAKRFEREQMLMRVREAGRATRARRAAEALDKRPEGASPALPAADAPETPPEEPPKTLRERREGLSGVWDSHALPGASGTPESGDAGDGKAGGREETGAGSASGGVRLGAKRRDDEGRVPPAPPSEPKRAPDLRAEDVLQPSRPEGMRERKDARIEPDNDKPREKTGLFARKDRTDASTAPPKPEKKPHFLDPDYKGPSKEQLDRARDLEKAIRRQKAREARRRADERDRRARDRDRDGPER